MPPSLALFAILKHRSNIKLVYKQWQHLEQTVVNILTLGRQCDYKKKKRTQGFNSRNVNISIPRSRRLFVQSAVTDKRYRGESYLLIQT